MAMALSIFGLFLFVFFNLNSFFTSWSRSVQLIVYLEDGMTKDEQKLFENKLTNNPDIEMVTFVSREVAWQNFQNLFPVDSGFLTSLKFNPLPASYNLQFKSLENKVEKIRQLAEILSKDDKVESVEYGEKWISRFETFMVMMGIFIYALGGLIFVGLILVIYNTIRLSVYTRKDEIELMLLIGATPRFIKVPYIFEGVTMAMTGAFISIGLIKLLHIYLNFQFMDSMVAITRGFSFQFFPFTFIVGFFVACASIGWIGGHFSISQFLNSYYKK
ncbi:MAG: cell division protein FtsX [Nitrospinales bacterium]